VFEKVGFFKGASEQAKKLGFQLEEFWLHEPGMSQRRFNQILVSRNIQGLLFIPQPRSHSHLRLDWDRFSAVRLGPTLSRPQLRMVDNDHYRSMGILLRELRYLGYKRPGFACLNQVNESISRHWSSGFFAFQNVPPSRQVPMFLCKEWRYKDFEAWYLEHRPDVVVSQALEPYEWLLKMGLRIPDDVGFAITARHAGGPHLSGIDENNELIGEFAVSIVADMINRGVRGIPPVSLSTQIEGTWVEGETLRKMS
jgi:LacI family transcriptional regulator